MTEGGQGGPGAAPRARDGLATWALWGVVAAGMATRLLLAVSRPLWADETFTLDLARRGAAEILAALRVDSGPPIHYLLAKAVLVPFPSPGPADVLVRLLSVAASLLHVPLLLSAGRRLGSGAAGLAAAAIFSAMPLAAWYGSEGRGYAVASLLVLLAFERSLAVRAAAEEAGEGRPAGIGSFGSAAVPAVGSAVVAGAAAAGALLCHYLSLFPLAGIALSLLPARRAAARLHLLSGAVAALLVLPWAEVALAQPHASLRWVASVPAWQAAPRAVASALLGVDGDGPTGALLAAAGLLAAVLLVSRFRGGGDGGRGNRAAGATLAGVSLLLLAGLGVPEILLPERCGVPFLPLAALALASLPTAATAAAGVTGLLLTVSSLTAWTAPTLSEDLGTRLLAASRPGERVVAAGLWGPELRYRFERAGRRGEVLLFPSDVERHPGWYDDLSPEEDGLRREALVLSRLTPPPRWWVVSRGERASDALRAEALRLGGRVAADTGVYEVWLLPAPAPAAVSDRLRPPNFHELPFRKRT